MEEDRLWVALPEGGPDPTARQPSESMDWIGLVTTKLTIVRGRHGTQIVRVAVDDG